MPAVPGSEALQGIMHVVSQSLLIPAIVTLLAFVAYSVVALGGLIAEYIGRVRVDVDEIKEAIYNISNPGDPKEIIEIINNSKLPERQKEILTDIANTEDLDSRTREALARRYVEGEELKAMKSVEITDSITRLGPQVGLLGTLIPIGPGLVALGAGDITQLANHFLVAFDAAILGLASSAISFFVSKVRKRWFEEYLVNLETLAEAILEVMENVEKEREKEIERLSP